VTHTGLWCQLLVVTSVKPRKRLDVLSLTGKFHRLVTLSLNSDEVTVSSGFKYWLLVLVQDNLFINCIRHQLTRSVGMIDVRGYDKTSWCLTISCHVVFCYEKLVTWEEGLLMFN